MKATTTSTDPWGHTLRRLGPAGKLRAAAQLYFAAREIKAAALRQKHPKWPDAEVKRRVDEAFWYARD